MVKEGEKKARNWKKIAIISSIIAILVTLSLVAFIIFSKASITITDELNLKIEPAQQSISANNSQTITLTFEITNENLLQCQTECKFTLLDESKSQELHKSTETLKHNQKLIKTYEVTTPARGKGQQLYAFESVCHNKQTYLCLTEEEKRLNRAVVAVNYELRETELRGVELKSSIENMLTLATNAKNTITAIPLEILPDGAIETKEIIAQSIEIEKKIESIFQKSTKLSQLWELEEYEKIATLYDDQDISELMQHEKDSIELMQSVQALAMSRNDNINQLIKIDADSALNAAEFYNYEESPANHEKLSYLSEAADDLFARYLMIFKNISHNEQDLNKEIKEVKSRLDDSILSYQTQLNRIAQTTNSGANELKSASVLIALNESMQANNPCNGLRIVIDEIEKYNSAPEPEDNQTENTTTTTAKIPINATPYELVLGEYCRNETFSENIEPDSVKRLRQIDKNYLDSTRLKVESLEVPPSEKAVLREIKSTCCALGQCDSCCEPGECDDEYYPILLIHGHAFNSKNSPDSSLSLFSELLKNLETKEYFNMGRLELKSNPNDLDRGTWGRMQTPVALKASYYYITHYKLGDYSVSVQNDDSIETYAIRLKEIIELVKQKTGRNKVILVAHSMGGLVAREYVLLFGTDNVEKLILINTPNNGISGRTQEWCSLFGSTKECTEMSKDSIFLSKLNSNEIPKKLPVYAIRSTGCDMNGEDGDGVVTAESQYLNGAKNYALKGNCTDALKSDPHNNALDTTKYPQTFEILKEILRD